jgi:hypothetical protein
VQPLPLLYDKQLLAIKKSKVQVQLMLQSVYNDTENKFGKLRQTCENRVAAWQVSTIISNSLNLKGRPK